MIVTTALKPIILAQNCATFLFYHQSHLKISLLIIRKVDFLYGSNRDGSTKYGKKSAHMITIKHMAYRVQL